MPEAPTQPNQPQVPTTPTKTISWPKVILTLAIIIIVTAIIAGIYWFFVLGKSTQDLSYGPIKPKPSTQVATPSATPSAQKDETASWKTFKDTKLGITFKYPNDWIIKPPNSDPLCDKDSLHLAPKKEYLGTCGSENFPLIYVKPPSDPRTGCAEGVTTTETVVGGKEATRCEYASEGPSEQNPGAQPKGTKNIDYYVPETKFAIWYHQYPDWPDYKGELEKIISTFKFL